MQRKFMAALSCLVILVSTGSVLAKTPRKRKNIQSTPNKTQTEVSVSEEKQPEIPPKEDKSEKKGLPVSVSYNRKNGFELKTDNGKFSMAIQNRIQFRYAYPFDKDPRSIGDLDAEGSSFMIRRARTKINGHAYWPWLKYYLQYDWSQPVLRDLSLAVEKTPKAKVLVGRRKVFYNDERVASSGNQQFVNRSIVNDIFTVDRQQGLQVYGNLFPNTWHDISYYTGVFSGLGVGLRTNDDKHMMYYGRLQWNPLGGEMPFSQSDVEFHEKPALNLAFAAATNRSKCTAFETDSNSCRALPGFEVGEDGQYRLNQMMEEVRFKWKGFSFQHELHWKNVIDTLKNKGDSERKTRLMGGYFQAGYFIVPKHLEIAGRYAFVDPDLDQGSDKQQEYSGVVNYFFSGHSNKLSFQVSHLSVQDPSERIKESNQRYWLQWDLSF